MASTAAWRRCSAAVSALKPPAATTTSIPAAPTCGARAPICSLTPFSAACPSVRCMAASLSATRRLMALAQTGSLPTTSPCL